ncbi:MAG: hypothetical protein ACI83D_000793 [Planctomycetota bacterium]|jgi:hypothetical protein
MNYSIKHFGLTVFASILMLGMFLSPQSSLAFCQFFLPPLRTFTPADDMRAFVAHSDGVEHIVVQPGFVTDAEDFAFVLALPARPTVIEAPKNIFIDLEDLTNPTTFFPPMMLGVAEITEEDSAKVVVVEQKIVGDFSVSVLTAESSIALVEWLDDNDYETTDSDLETFEYYVSQGGHYFAALKITNPLIDDENNILMLPPTHLSAIEFTFASPTPVLPTRILAGTGGEMSLALYTLGDNPLYIPGVDILYSQKLSQNDFQKISYIKTPTSAEEVWYQYYDIENKWLVRHDLRLDPQSIISDLVLTQGTEQMNISIENAPKRITPELFRPGIGIVAGTAQTLDMSNNYQALYSSRLLQRGVRGEDVRALQQILNDKQHESLVADGIWGTKTEAAVRRFQTTYSIQIDGIVGPQTKDFMQRL